MKFTIAATLLASASAFSVNQPKVDFGKVRLPVDHFARPTWRRRKDRAKHAFLEEVHTQDDFRHEGGQVVVERVDAMNVYFAGVLFGIL